MKVSCPPNKHSDKVSVNIFKKVSKQGLGFSSNGQKSSETVCKETLNSKCYTKAAVSSDDIRPVVESQL